MLWNNRNNQNSLHNLMPCDNWKIYQSFINCKIWNCLQPIKHDKNMVRSSARSAVCYCTQVERVLCFGYDDIWIHLNNKARHAPGGPCHNVMDCDSVWEIAALWLSFKYSICFSWASESSCHFSLHAQSGLISETEEGRHGNPMIMALIMSLELSRSLPASSQILFTASSWRCVLASLKDLSILQSTPNFQWWRVIKNEVIVVY